MLLQFPTGSCEDNTENDGKSVCAAIYFMRDGTWSMKTHTDADEYTIDVAKEFMEFMFYAKDRTDVIQDFNKWKKTTGAELMDLWRKDNIKLIKND